MTIMKRHATFPDEAQTATTNNELRFLETVSSRISQVASESGTGISSTDDKQLFHHLHELGRKHTVSLPLRPKPSMLDVIAHTGVFPRMRSSTSHNWTLRMCSTELQGRLRDTVSSIPFRLSKLFGYPEAESC